MNLEDKVNDCQKQEQNKVEQAPALPWPLIPLLLWPRTPALGSLATEDWEMRIWMYPVVFRTTASIDVNYLDVNC